jgi:hypothetical protein
LKIRGFKDEIQEVPGCVKEDRSSTPNTAIAISQENMESSSANGYRFLDQGNHFGKTRIFAKMRRFSLAKAFLGAYDSASH